MIESIAGYKLLTRLGVGTNASVYKVFDEKKETYFILKYYKYIEDSKLFENEINSLKIFNRNKNRIRYIKNGKHQSGKYILFEYKNTISLQNYIRQLGRFTFEQCLKMLEDILEDIKFLYGKKILHLDLKAGNIVYDEENFYLIDFGNAHPIKDIVVNNVNFNSLYMAPEIYDGQRTMQSEIYSLGCILYYMASNRNINNMFLLKGTSTKAEKIFAHLYKEPKYASCIPHSFVSLMEKMLQKNPKNRPNIEELGILIKNLKEKTTVNELSMSNFDIYKKLSDDNIGYGIYKVGLSYENGLSVKKDLEKAKLYYRKAIAKNHANAYFSLAVLIKNEDEIEAKKLFEKALEYKIKEACIYLDNKEDKVNYFLEQYKYFLFHKAYHKAIISLNKVIKITSKSKYYNMLGLVHKSIGDDENYLLNLKKGLLIDPNKKSILFNLVDLYNKNYDFFNAKKLLIRLEKLYSNDAVIYRKFAVMYKESHQFEKAIDAYKMALKINSNNAEVKNGLGQLLILLGKYEEGFAFREARLEFKKNNSISSKCIGKLYKGEKLNNKTILVYREQGLGDVIHYIRYLKLLKEMGAKIIFRVNHQLEELSRSLDSVDELLINDDTIKDVKYDYHVSLLSLPYHFLKKGYEIPSTCPYLFLPKNTSTNVYIDKNKFNIGIAWEGGTKSQNNKKRNVDLSYFESLFDIDNISLYSLQLDRQNEAIYELGYENNIIDISDKLNSFLDTALVMKDLDLIISVDTSVVHLAGALNYNVWMPTQYTAEYRWGIKDEFSYWYPSLKFFRETKRKEDGNWEDVFSNIKTELRLEVNKKRINK